MSWFNNKQLHPPYQERTLFFKVEIKVSVRESKKTSKTLEDKPKQIGSSWERGSKGDLLITLQSTPYLYIHRLIRSHTELCFQTDSVIQIFLF